jgi:hypothetical protein
LYPAAVTLSDCKVQTLRHVARWGQDAPARWGDRPTARLRYVRCPQERRSGALRRRSGVVSPRSASRGRYPLPRRCALLTAGDLERAAMVRPSGASPEGPSTRGLTMGIRSSASGGAHGLWQCPPLAFVRRHRAGPHLGANSRPGTRGRWSADLTGRTRAPTPPGGDLGLHPPEADEAQVPVSPLACTRRAARLRHGVRAVAPSRARSLRRVTTAARAASPHRCEYHDAFHVKHRCTAAHGGSAHRAAIVRAQPTELTSSRPSDVSTAARRRTVLNERRAKHPGSRPSGPPFHVKHSVAPPGVSARRPRASPRRTGGPRLGSAVRGPHTRATAERQRDAPSRARRGSLAATRPQVLAPQHAPSAHRRLWQRQPNVASRPLRSQPFHVKHRGEPEPPGDGALRRATLVSCCRQRPDRLRPSTGGGLMAGSGLVAGGRLMAGSGLGGCRGLVRGRHSAGWRTSAGEPGRKGL